MSSKATAVFSGVFLGEVAMPLFSLLVILLFKKPTRYWVFRRGKTIEESIFKENPLWGVYNKCHDKVVVWHKKELEKLDYDFRIQQASLRLVRARMNANEKGIDPLSSQYPDLYDFISPPKIELPK